MRAVNWILALVIAGVALVAQPAGAHTPATSDQHATLEARSVLSWLTHLPNRAGNRVVSGYFGGYSGNTFSLDQTNALFQQTGQRPGLLACDYASFQPQPIDPSCNSTLIDWSRHGGLVTVSVHFPSPDRISGGLNKHLDNFGSLTDPQSPLGTQWRADLDAVAAGLLELQAAGVPVLFRPLHEMNSTSFWWSNQRPAEFAQVWRAMFAHFTSAGLHNLLWVYAPIAGAGNRTAYFPGAEYADIVGMSAYSDNPAEVTGYEEMLTLGKPFAFTEIGPQTTPADGQVGGFDYRKWSNAIHERFPATSYFQTWNDKWSPIRHQHATELMNDRWVVNRGEISLSAQTEVSRTPVAGPATLLAGFESATLEGWSGHGTKDGPWAVSEWAAQGDWSLKADVDLAAGETYLSSGPRDLRGVRELTAFVRTALWGNHAAGTSAKLYVRTTAVDWRDNGSVLVGPDGVTLSVSLDGIPDLAQVREIGVSFTPAPGATGGSAIYVDYLSATRSPTVLWGFENGLDGWYATRVKNGPWPVTEWAAQGTSSMKADVDLAAGESGFHKATVTNLSGYTLLSATVRTAPWGNQGAGSWAKLYVKTGAGLVWHDSGNTFVGPDGVTLTLNIAGLPDVREIGVYIRPADTANGGSAIYLDGVTAS